MRIGSGFDWVNGSRSGSGSRAKTVPKKENSCLEELFGRLESGSGLDPDSTKSGSGARLSMAWIRSRTQQSLDLEPDLTKFESGSES